LAVLGVFVSVGTAGVPGAATVAAATVLSAAHLPLEFVAATIPIGVIADMARTATNVTAAAVSATVVARQTGLLDDEIFAGRRQFVDQDELAESEVLTPRVPVPAPVLTPVPVAPAPAAVGAAAATPAPAQSLTPFPVPVPVPAVPAAGPYGGLRPAYPQVYWGSTELAATGGAEQA
jgi:hypothetical protein